MGSIEIDTSGLPLVTVRFCGSVEDAEFTRYLQTMRAVLDSGARYVTILDAREAGVVPAPQRRQQADYLLENRARVAVQCLGAAFVMSSPVVRGVLTAILWLQPMPCPHTVVGTVDEAEDWARRKLAEAGSPIAPTVTAPVSDPLPPPPAVPANAGARDRSGRASRDA